MDTSGCSSYPRTPTRSPDSAAAFIAAFTFSTVVSSLSSNTQSVSEPLRSGTRTASPFSFPFSSGKMSAMAVAEPVEVGAKLVMPERARRKSLFLLFGASTIVCVLVTLWMVVMEPRLMPPSLFCTTETTGARQFVVHDAAVTILSFASSYNAWFTPYTMFRTGSVASLTGAETSTRLTPLAK